MWNCKNCGKENRDSRDTCWNCKAERNGKTKIPTPTQTELIKCPNCHHLNSSEMNHCERCQNSLYDDIAQEIREPELSQRSDPSKPLAPNTNGIYCSSCGHLNDSSSVQCEKCQTPLMDLQSQKRKHENQSQKQKFNRISLALGLPGMLLQGIGALSDISILLVLGSIMFLIGLVYYAKAKGRSGWWGLLGLLSLIGLIILSLLPSKSDDAGIPLKSVKTQGQDLGLENGQVTLSTNTIDGRYCPVCGFFNPGWRNECENCQTRLIVEKRCQSIKRDGTQCNRKPLLSSKRCWQHNIPLIISLIIVSGALLFLLGLWTDLINITFINPSTTFLEANDKGIEAYEGGQYDKAIDYFKFAAKKARKSGNKAAEATNLYNTGEIYRLQGEFDLALEYYRQAGVTNQLYAKGVELYKEGKYDEALEYLQLALPIAQERDSPEKGDVLNLLGIIFHELEDYEKSIESYKQSLDFFERDGNHQAKTMILNNLGLVYSSHGLHGLAIQHLEMAGSGEKLYEIGKEKFDQEEYHLASTYLEAALVVAQQDYNNENQGHIFSMLAFL